MSPSNACRAVAALCIAAASTAAWNSPVLAADLPPTGIYEMRDGKVDVGTYRGWATYHIACASCHGKDALTGGMAPDLMQSIRSMSRQAFAEKVLSRYRVSLGLTESLFSDTARQSVLAGLALQDDGAPGTSTMPAWQADPAVSARVLDLYAYLKARSDGALAVGRPKTWNRVP